MRLKPVSSHSKPLLNETKQFMNGFVRGKESLLLLTSAGLWGVDFPVLLAPAFSRELAFGQSLTDCGFA